MSQQTLVGSRDADHTCHAKGCNVRVAPALLMCARHWRMVPRLLQRAVYATYVTGQEVRMDPSEEYLAAAQAAVDWVAYREGKLDG